ncbi:hypothetical protein GNIT_2337 [Glaciecola nitratireducens FR1064]|uniref:Uncharacterized protein n=1 Tax=Glaciecola nitratireducens (strain JCM 12485 / KCTC 12276 / FR1064) TaxID=1085623 RepID=G4QLU4_GLANF|nr:hypothetical protein GNIT_2337 [Glaciecola nitratireducens FR1064]
MLDSNTSVNESNKMLFAKSISKHLINTKETCGETLQQKRERL